MVSWEQVYLLDPQVVVGMSSAASDAEFRANWKSRTVLSAVKAGRLVFVEADRIRQETRCVRRYERSFMRPLFVVLLLKTQKCQLLSPQVPFWWRSRLLLQGLMHALVTPILLRLARFNPFVPNSQPQPFHR